MSEVHVPVCQLAKLLRMERLATGGAQNMAAFRIYGAVDEHEYNCYRHVRMTPSRVIARCDLRQAFQESYTACASAVVVTSPCRGA